MQTILGISELRFPPGWCIERHTHTDFYEMLLVTGGSMESDTAGRRFRGQAGSTLVHPPGREHQEWNPGATPLRMYCLLWQGDGPERGQSSLCFDAENRMGMLLRWLLEIGIPRSGPQATLQENLFCALLSEYVNGGQPGEDMLRQVKHYILEHLAEPLTLADLAGVACLSKYHFARLFRQAAGQTPMAYVRQVRLEAARNLLLTSRMPLHAIAPQVGLRDEFHLSRVFHRHFGCPPGALRACRPPRQRLSPC